MKRVQWMMVVMVTVMLHVYAYADSVLQDEHAASSMTWQELGIGIHNPGEIKDWTYYGILTPKEASMWIDALKPLGNISYASAARLWVQNGFSAQETKAWVAVGAKSPESAKWWMNSGVKNPKELKQWQQMGVKDRYKIEAWMLHGVSTPQEVQKWISIGVNTPDEVDAWQKIGIKTAAEVQQWKAIGVNHASDASKWIQAGVGSTQEVQQWQAIGVHDGYTCQKWKERAKATTPREAKKWMDASLSADEVESRKLQESMSSAGTSVHERSTEESINNLIPENYQGSSSGGGEGFVLIYFGLMIFTIFKGVGENRTIVIFRDYNDLGLTFLIPVSAFLIVMLFTSFGGNPQVGMLLALVVVAILFGILARNTYEDNHGSFLYTILAVLTKIPLAFIWVINFIAMLNPGGKTQRERRKNRNSAMLILAFLTPIIGMLVVKKEGSLFNPRDWIKGRRVGSIRNHL